MFLSAEEVVKDATREFWAAQRRLLGAKEALKEPLRLYAISLKPDDVKMGDIVIVRFTEGEERVIYEGIEIWQRWDPEVPPEIQVKLRCFTTKGEPFKDYHRHSLQVFKGMRKVAAGPG